MMDSRDYLDQDGWPTFPPRDKLPLVQLLTGAALTASFTQRERALPQYRTNYPQRLALKEERDAVAYELLLPSWWHLMPVRKHRCQDKRRPAPEPVKPLYWRRR